MHINEVILREMASKKLFHYTNVQSALAILKNQEFRLTVAVGADSEVNSGYHYYLSTSRNKVNDYTRSVSDNGVMFNLNGDFFNRHYKVKPIDYWGRDMWLSSHKTKQPDEEYRTSEQEDRVLSNKPTIKFNGKATEAIESVHVLLTSAGKLSLLLNSWAYLLIFMITPMILNYNILVILLNQSFQIKQRQVLIIQGIMGNGILNHGLNYITKTTIMI